MELLLKPLQDLSEKFRSLDGVGKKSAIRMAFSVLNMSEEDAESFAKAILDAKTKICLCKRCQSISENDICSICASETRDHSVVCVVEDAQSVMALEKVKEYNLDVDVYFKALTEENVKAFHDAGIVVNCWTVNGRDDGERLASWGVDDITTNILE